MWQGISDSELPNSSPKEGKSKLFFGLCYFLVVVVTLDIGFTPVFMASEQFMCTICLTSHYVEFVNHVPKIPCPPMWMLCWGSLLYKRKETVTDV